MREGQLSAISHVSLEADCDIQGAGWGEPIVSNSRVVAMVNAQVERTCVAIPASFIQSVIEARKKGQYQGLGYFHFYWQPAANPASLARLKLSGEPRGVIVIQVPDRPDGGEQVLKPQDIILNIDGFDVDIQGDYEDPEFGHLMLENLATHGRWAGDDIKMKIWRDGKPLEVTYRLPKYDYSTTLVPFATFDRYCGDVFMPQVYWSDRGVAWRAGYDQALSMIHSAGLHAPVWTIESNDDIYHGGAPTTADLNAYFDTAGPFTSLWEWPASGLAAKVTQLSSLHWAN